MPVKDCMTGSPFCTDKDYKEFRDPILSEASQFTSKKDTKHNGVPKHIFAKQKGEQRGRFSKFADSVHQLKNKTEHHM